MLEKDINLSDLRDTLDYCEITGNFIVKIASKYRPKGSSPETNHSNGYKLVCIFGVRVYAHRLAWFYYYGEWPSKYIDHINGIKSDNRIANLRLASKSDNGCNKVPSIRSSTGVRGVYKSGKNYYVQIAKDSIKYNGGSYKTLQEASVAAQELRLKLHKSFAYNE